MSQPPSPQVRFAAPQAVGPSVRRFLANEAGGGAALLIATVLALGWANSPWAEEYHRLWAAPAVFRVGDLGIGLDLRHVVNDAAMAVFFLVIGLEINRELTGGRLRDRRTALVPALGALGGLVTPVLIYLLCIGGGPAARGWGIVMSTDTAFVLGVLALFGPRCPDRLRLFLLTLAIVDDIGAISVLALCYTAAVDPAALLGAALLTAVLAGLRRAGVWRLAPYVCVGIALWAALYRSGVHPTLAGALLGLLMPTRPTHAEPVLRQLPIHSRALLEEPTPQRARLAALTAVAGVPVGERLQRALHPWSAYLVIPAFGLANAGVTLTGPMLRQAAASSVTVGVAVALVAGNVIGIFGASTLALRARLGVLPGGVRYGHLLGGAFLAGIGFTISLFVAEVAFGETPLHDEAKIGVLAGSLIAAVIGAVLLRVLGERWPLCSPEDQAVPPALPPLPWTAPPPPGRP